MIIWAHAGLSRMLDLDQSAYTGLLREMLANLAKESRDNWVLGEWREFFRIQNTVAVRIIAVFCTYMAAIDNQFGEKGVGVFPVDQDIRGDFAKNYVTDADTGLNSSAFPHTFLSSSRPSSMAWQRRTVCG